MSIPEATTKLEEAAILMRGAATIIARTKCTDSSQARQLRQATERLARAHAALLEATSDLRVRPLRTAVRLMWAGPRAFLRYGRAFHEAAESFAQATAASARLG